MIECVEALQRNLYDIELQNRLVEVKHRCKCHQSYIAQVAKLRANIDWIKGGDKGSKCVLKC